MYIEHPLMSSSQQFTDRVIFDQANVKTALFSLDGQTVVAKVVKVYDADTIHIVFPVFGKLMKFKTRFIGIDSAEIRSKNPDEKIHAKKARDILKSKIHDKLVRVECGEFDKYGRLLVKVFPYKAKKDTNAKAQDDPTTSTDGQTGGDPGSSTQEDPTMSSEGDPVQSYNDWLIDQKLAYSYDGGTKQKFPDWTL